MAHTLRPDTHPHSTRRARPPRVPRLSHGLAAVAAALLLLGGLAPATRADVQATLRVCRSGCEHAALGDALAVAQDGDQILIGTGAYAGNVVVDKSLRIRGASAANTVLEGGGDGATVFVREGARVTIADLTITGGVSPTGGGVVNLGALTLQDVVVRGNRAEPAAAGEQSYGGGVFSFEGSLTLRRSRIEDNEAGLGGGIYALGTTVLEDSEVVGNRATSGGGGIYNFDGSLLVHNSLVADNRVTGSGPGGGIYNYSVVALTYSLVAGNEAVDFGGGVYQRRGGTYVTNSTISGNDAGFGGGGLYLLRGEGIVTSATMVGNGGSFGGAINVQVDAEIEVLSTIVADSPGSNCFGEVRSLGYNLDSGNTCNFEERDDQVNTSAGLEPLADNGGFAATHALQPSSAAVDRGDSAGCTDFNGYDTSTDQRGRDRHVDGDEDGAARCDVGAFELDPEATGPPPPPAPAACEGITVCPGGCDHATVAAAVQAAPAGATICIAEGELTEQLVVDKDLRLQGAHAALTRIAAGDDVPVLRTEGEVAVEIAHLALVDSAGVLNPAGTLTLEDCEISGHAAPAEGAEDGPRGSGVRNGGVLEVERCRFKDNFSFGSGGAIDSRAGQAIVRDTHFEGNTAASEGGAVAVGADSLLTVERSTFVGNESQTGGALAGRGPLVVQEGSFTGNVARYGGGLYAAGGLELRTSAFQRNQADLGGAVYVAGAGTLEDNRIFGNIATGEFGYGGGVYLSDADATIRGGLISDNFATNGGGVSAQGQLELAGLTMSGNRASFGGALIQFNGMTISDGQTQLSTNVAFSRGGAGYLVSGVLELTGSAIRDNTSVRDAGAFLVAEDATLEGRGAELSNNTAEVAGAVWNAGTLRWHGGQWIDNGASGGVPDEVEDPGEEPEERPGRGGALLNAQGADARLEATLLAGNGAELGGAIWNAGRFEAQNTTISDNGADVAGGGLYNAGGTAVLRNLTVVLNTADAEAEGGGALRNGDGGQLQLGHSVVGLSVGVDDCVGVIDSDGHNVASDDSCALDGPGDVMGVDPRLDDLQGVADTRGHPPLPSSPVIDAGDPQGCPGLDGEPLEVDQAGRERPVDGDEDGQAVCDSGALEWRPGPPPTATPGTVGGPIYLPRATR